MVETLRDIIAQVETAQSLMMRTDWWRNSEGHLTDAALWIDLANRTARQALQEIKP